MKEEETCPICKEPESQPAHCCEGCSEYVCQDCYNFEESICLNCENK